MADDPIRLSPAVGRRQVRNLAHLRLTLRGCCEGYRGVRMRVVCQGGGVDESKATSKPGRSRETHPEQLPGATSRRKWAGSIRRPVGRRDASGGNSGPKVEGAEREWATVIPTRPSPRALTAPPHAQGWWWVNGRRSRGQSNGYRVNQGPPAHGPAEGVEDHPAVGPCRELGRAELREAGGGAAERPGGQDAPVGPGAPRPVREVLRAA